MDNITSAQQDTLTEIGTILDGNGFTPSTPVLNTRSAKRDGIIAVWGPVTGHEGATSWAGMLVGADGAVAVYETLPEIKEAFRQV